MARRPSKAISKAFRGVAQQANDAGLHDRARSARIVRDGGHGSLPEVAAARDLGAETDDVLAANSLSAPDRVAVRHRPAVQTPEGRYTFPAHSVTVLDFDLA